MLGKSALIAACGLCLACSWLGAPPMKVSSEQLPQGGLVFQPKLHFASGEPTYQGTGFFVKHGGSVVAVTSAHFLEAKGPRLLRAEWLRVGGEKEHVVASCSRSLGMPGKGFDPYLDDLRGDYLVMPLESTVPEDVVLELDEREKPRWRERVWLPNKDPGAPRGYQLLEGVVELSTSDAIRVEFPRFELESQSGSPVISRTTGKVIGTVSRGCEESGKMRLQLAPSRAILDAIAAARDRPELKNVIGR
jgi:hypothetical protein